MSQTELKRPPVNWWAVVLGIVLLILLIAVAGFIRFVILVPAEPEVEVIALGGGALLPGDALAARSVAGGSAVSVASGIRLSSPIGPKSILVGDEPAVLALGDLRLSRASDGRIALLTDTGDLSAADATNIVAIAIRATAMDKSGVRSLEIEIDGAPLRFESDGLATGGIIPARAPVTHLTQDICLILQPWGSAQASGVRSHVLTPGLHSIEVVAVNGQGVRGRSKPITLQATYTQDEWQLWKAVTGVESCEAGLFPATTPPPQIVNTPPPPFTPAPTSTPPPVTVTPTPIYPCRDDSALVADVSVPDGTRFDPGATFNKTWRLRNTGTCTWNTRYQLVYVGGAQLGTVNAVNLPHDVPPGGEVEITVSMVAPGREGQYRSYWQMRNPDCGNLFGVTIYAHIIVHPGAGDLPVITRFEVIPPVINRGEQATLYWEYINGTTARLHPGDQAVGPGGSLVVSPDVTTSYLLIVSNAAGAVQRATTLSVRPGPLPGPPPASPANLTISAIHRDGFELAWTDTSNDEQGFRLVNASTGQAMATFPANATRGTILGLNCGTLYSFYIVSFNERGDSWPGNVVQASTSACDG